MDRGNLFIVAAPSGAGKTSLVRRLVAEDARVDVSISCTTRPPRPGETDGVDYHFVDRNTFQSMREADDFLESAEVYGHFYGTSRRWLTDAMAGGRDIILEIDWQGAQQVRRLMPQAHSIFILPPSLETLATRLAGRGQDAAEVIDRRLAAAREDIRHCDDFEYIIVNDDFETAFREMSAIFTAARLTRQRQLAANPGLLDQLLN